MSLVKSLAEKSGLPLEVLEAIGIEEIESVVEDDEFAASIVVETLVEKMNEIGIDGLIKNAKFWRNALEVLNGML